MQIKKGVIHFNTILINLSHVAYIELQNLKMDDYRIKVVYKSQCFGFLYFDNNMKERDKCFSALTAYLLEHGFNNI